MIGKEFKEIVKQFGFVWKQDCEKFKALRVHVGEREIRLYGTTLSQAKEIVCRIPGGCDSETVGACVIPYSLAKVVAAATKAGDEVSIFAGDSPRIEKGRASWPIPTGEGIATVDDFPEFDLRDIETAPVLLMAGEDYQAAVDRASFATSDERARFQLGGVHFEAHPDGTTFFSATDGHRLSRQRSQSEGATEKVSALIPKAAAVEISKSLPKAGAEVLLTVAPRRLLAEWGTVFGSVRFLSTLLEDNFPPIAGILDQATGRATVSFTVKADSLAETVKMVSTATVPKSSRYGQTLWGSKPIRVSVGEGGEITVSPSIVGDRTATATMDADTVSLSGAFRVHAGYFLDALKAFSGEWIRIYQTKDGGPLWFLAESENPACPGNVQLIMPLSVSEEIEAEEAGTPEELEAVEAA